MGHPLLSRNSLDPIFLFTDAILLLQEKFYDKLDWMQKQSERNPPARDRQEPVRTRPVAALAPVRDEDRTHHFLPQSRKHPTRPALAGRRHDASRRSRAKDVVALTAIPPARRTGSAPGSWSRRETAAPDGCARGSQAGFKLRVYPIGNAVIRLVAPLSIGSRETQGFGRRSVCRADATAARDCSRRSCGSSGPRGGASQTMRPISRRAAPWRPRIPRRAGR